MKSNLQQRNERIAKVAEFLPELPEQTLVVNDFSQILTHLSEHRWSHLSHQREKGTVHPLGEYQAVVMRLDTNKNVVRMLLAFVNQVIKEGTEVWLVGGNDEGIKSIPQTVEGLLFDVQTIEIKQRSRLLRGYSTGKSLEFDNFCEDVNLAVGKQENRLWRVVPGIFAKGQLDAGTQLLLEYLEENPLKRAKQLGDYACGAGFLAGWLKAQYPEAHVDAFDNSSWAVACAKSNLPNVHCVLSNGWKEIPNDRRYDLLLSNPPVHIGKEQDFTVLQDLLQGAKTRLHFNGKLVMVVQHHIPIERLVKEGNKFRHCKMVKHNAAYKIWEVWG